MKIGQKIKYYREKMGITQACLAEKLNVSTQAVSKWETESTYPDITLIPALAEYFKVSCDALLTENGKTETERIGALLAEADRQDANTRGGYLARISILEDALERYPHSCRLMLELAYAYSTGTDYPEYQLQGWGEKVIALCERVYARSESLRERYGAATLLCYHYSGTDNARVIELAEQMPEIYQSRPALIYHGYTGEEKRVRMHDYYTELLDTAQSILGALNCRSEQAESLFEALRRMI